MGQGLTHGLYFAGGGSTGYAMAGTKRTDLQQGRMALHASKVTEWLLASRRAATDGSDVLPAPIGVVAVVLTPSISATQKVVSVLTEFWRSRGRVLVDADGDEHLALTAEDVSSTLVYCLKAWGLKSVSHLDVLRAHRRGTADAVNQGVIEYLLLQDPHLSDAQYWHDKALHPDKNDVGMIKLPVNMMTLIGGLSRVRNRSEAHRLAAALFRNQHDRSLLGGPKAVDLSAQRVDTSSMSASAVAEIGAIARADYKNAVDAMGSSAALIERVIVQDASVTDIAKSLFGNVGGTARAKVSAMLLSAMDKLATYYGLMGRVPGARDLRNWHDGSPMVDDDGVILGRRAEVA